MSIWRRLTDPTYGLPDPKELQPVEQVRKSIDAVCEGEPCYRVISTELIRQMIDVAYQDGYLQGFEEGRA